MLLLCNRTTGPILIWKILVRASFPCTVIDSNALILLSVQVWMKNDISMGSQIYSECGVLEVRECMESARDSMSARVHGICKSAWNLNKRTELPIHPGN